MWKSIFLVSIVSLAAQEAAFGQPVSSADVNIVSVTGALNERSFTCTVVINNQNDDDSQMTRVIVLMPLQVNGVQGHVMGGPGSCKPAPTVGTYQEYAICDLQSLPQGPTVRRTVVVRSSRSTAGKNYSHTCSAFVYSAVGDIEKANNYMVAAPVN
jgi:hypothetical protein